MKGAIQTNGGGNFLKRAGTAIVVLTIGVLLSMLCVIFYTSRISMKPDENPDYRLNQHPEISIQLRGRSVPVRYYTVESRVQHAVPLTRVGRKETKAAILFVHGFRDNALYFERIARCFVGRGYRAFLLELPGYDAASWRSQGAQGTSPALDEYAIPVFAEYLQHVIEALEVKHHVERREWIIWGHSMGGAIVYRAMTQNPAMFLQFDHVVLEAPAFASRLTFGSKFTIWLSKPLQKYAVGKFIGRKLIEAYIVKQGTSPEVVSYKPRTIEGFTDSYSIFHQIAASIKHPTNNFDAKILQEVGRDRLLWVWSSKDQAVNANPPEVIPAKQQIRTDLEHTGSLAAPQEVCQQVDQKFAELKFRTCGRDASCAHVQRSGIGTPAWRRKWERF